MDVKTTSFEKVNSPETTLLEHLKNAQLNLNKIFFTSLIKRPLPKKETTFYPLRNRPTRSN